MERSRDSTIDRIERLLQRAGFFVSDTHSIRPTSFDLMARRDSQLLILKVLKNIDALDPEEASRLRELSGLFGAAPLVIGQTSGSTELESGVVYGRYGVPIVDEGTLEDFLLKGFLPFLFSSPGGIFARIDGGRLRALRELHQLSLGALASVAGVSRRTIQLYEEGTGAEIAVVERLETFLGEPIARPIEMFPSPAPPPRRSSAEEEETSTRRSRHRPPENTGDPLRDGVFRKLDGMGWNVVVTIRCPFDAFTRDPSEEVEQILLTSVGTVRTAQHRAEVLHQLARVAEGHALFVVGDQSAHRSIGGLAVLTVHELKRHQDREELLETISERESA